MSPNPSTVRRAFDVTKDDGTSWKLLYTAGGVQWIPSPRPEGQGTAPWRRPSSSMPWGYPAESMMAVADTAANLMLAWESRQQRLREEAAAEEARRSQWLLTMLNRWAEAHSGSDRVDLVVSEYLAREAEGMMNVVLTSKRIAFPQSLLYDVASVKQVLSSYRNTMREQFHALASSPVVDLSSDVARVMPGRRLDLAFIDELSTDPELEWNERVLSRSTADFDRELTALARTSAAFQKRLFSSTELAQPTAGESPQRRRLGQKLAEIITPALPRFALSEYKPDTSEKRDAYRELVLLPAEVTRAKALTAAWLATTEVIATASERRVVVTAGADGLELGTAAAIGRGQLCR